MPDREPIPDLIDCYGQPIRSDHMPDTTTQPRDKTGRPTDHSPEAIRARYAAASEHVADLCARRERWTMRIPAQPDRDTDLVISDLPEDDIDRPIWTVSAEYCGNGRWAVMLMGHALCADDRWEFTGTPPSNKGERYDRDTAIRLAREWAGKVAYRGMTAADVLAKTGKEQT